MAQNILKTAAVLAAVAPILRKPRDAAMVLGVSRRYLDQLRLHGLPFIKIGSRVLYDPTECAAWLKANQTDDPNWRELAAQARKVNDEARRRPAK